MRNAIRRPTTRSGAARRQVIGEAGAKQMESRIMASTRSTSPAEVGTAVHRQRAPRSARSSRPCPTRVGGARRSRSAPASVRSRPPATGSASRTGPNGAGKTACSSAISRRMPAARAGASVAVGDRPVQNGHGRGPTAGRCLRGGHAADDPADDALLAKFGLKSNGDEPRPPPANAPGPRWRCCRLMASVNLLVLDEPTTSTCPRSNRLEQALDMTGRLRSPTTGGCSTPCAWTSARWHEDGGITVRQTG